MTCDIVAKKVEPRDVVGQCQCRAGVQLSPSDPILTTKKYPHVNEVMGNYRFENKLHEGKPFYVKRKQGVAHYIYFAKGTWNIAKQLGSASPIIKVDKNEGI